jgi:hypothetical protein
MSVKQPNEEVLIISENAKLDHFLLKMLKRRI